MYEDWERENSRTEFSGTTENKQSRRLDGQIRLVDLFWENTMWFNEHARKKSSFDKFLQVLIIFDRYIVNFNKVLAQLITKIYFF